MNKSLTLTIMFSIGIAGLSACSLNLFDSKSLARIDQKSITATDLALRLIRIPGLKDASPKVQEETALQLIESIIDDEILYLEATKRGIKASNAMVQHAILDHETILGPVSFTYFRQSNYLSRETLEKHYQKQLAALEYLSRIQKEEQAFCSGGFEMQFSQNCIKRQDFLKKVRQKYHVVVNRNLIPSALKAILESAK